MGINYLQKHGIINFTTLIIALLACSNWIVVGIFNFDLLYIVLAQYPLVQYTMYICLGLCGLYHLIRVLLSTKIANSKASQSPNIKKEGEQKAA